MNEWEYIKMTWSNGKEGCNNWLSECVEVSAGAEVDGNQRNLMSQKAVSDWKICDLIQAMGMAQNKSDWRRFEREYDCGLDSRNEPQNKGSSSYCEVLRIFFLLRRAHT